MRGKIVLAGLILSLSGIAISAQDASPVPIRKDLYCSGIVSTEAIPRDTYVITGEGSNYKITFQEGDYVYVNKGAKQGVKVGAPKYMEWYGAFGIVVTLVWLYLEILRLLSKLRSRN